MCKRREGLKLRSMVCLAAVHFFAGSLPIIVSTFIAVNRLPAQLQNVASSMGKCEAADNEELFSVDVGKQKEAIGKEFERIDDLLSQAKLQEVRSSIDVLEHKIDRIRKSLTIQEADAWLQKIDKARKSIPLKEDSLVNKAVEVLHTQGVDAALQYTQNDLRQHGVSDAKISAIEKRILEEAPAIKQAQERDEIARALKMFESGQLPDSTVDPYIVRTAQLIRKAREDSVKRIEDAKKRKEMEEQERVERARMEKEMKEKKIEEERLAKQRKEDEKKKAIEEKAERKRLEAEEKERLRQARIEGERQKKLLAKQKDSIASAEKINVRKAELERASRLRIAEAREQRLQIEEGQNAPPPVRAKDSGEAPRKPAEQAPDKAKENQQAAQAEEQRMKLRAQQGKAIHDSIEQRKQQAALLEEERTKQLLAEREKARNDSIEQQRKAQQSVSKQSQPPPAISTAPPSLPPADKTQKNVAAAAPQPKPASSMELAAARPRPEAVVTDKSAQAYLQNLKDKQKDAQRKVMEIYDLIEQKRGKEALEKFKRERAFIGQFVEAQVFTVLEQTVMQSVIQEQPAAATGAGGSAASSSAAKKTNSPEQECYNRINGYLRDNKVDAAYREFKRGEKLLKASMTKSDFKQLKNMVENAHKLRHAD